MYYYVEKIIKKIKLFIFSLFYLPALKLPKIHFFHFNKTKVKQPTYYPNFFQKQPPSYYSGKWEGSTEEIIPPGGVTLPSYYWPPAQKYPFHPPFLFFKQIYRVGRSRNLFHRYGTCPSVLRNSRNGSLREETKRRNRYNIYIYHFLCLSLLMCFLFIVCRHRYIGSDDPDRFFPDRERTRICYEILQNTAYARRHLCEIGMSTISSSQFGRKERQKISYGSQNAYCWYTYLMTS